MPGTIDLGRVVGDPGEGIPAGGRANQVLMKNSADDYDGKWGNAVLSINGETPDPITGDALVTEVAFAKNLVTDDSVSDTSVFIERTTGGTASIADGDAWITNIAGRMVRTGYVAQSVVMTVTAGEREEEESMISAVITEEDFLAEMANDSGTMTFSYDGTDWDNDPYDYGIDVAGDLVDGDEISVTYQKEVRGTITVSDPQELVSTGWNLYNNDNGYARVLNYSNSYGFLVGGTFTTLEFSETLTGTRTTITPLGYYFTVPSDGYIWVTGGNDTDTYILMTWSDWTSGPDGSFEAYSESLVDLSDIMDEFPNGLMQVGSVADEIDLEKQMAYSRIERVAYTAENLAAAISSGRDYIYDQNYIYEVRAAAVVIDIADYEVDGKYTANDHGMEILNGTDVAPQVTCLYGDNLVDKLRHDIPEQLTSLTSQIANIIQESVFTVEVVDNMYHLVWHGASGECPWSVTQSGADYHLNFTYNT